MKKKNIILVEDHVVVRDGLQELIGKLGPYQVTGAFSNGQELLDAFPMAEQPDLIIMDMAMPGMSGDETMENLNKRESEVLVLVLTLNHDEDKVIRMFRLGARGYLHKNSSAVILKQALGEIFRTGYYHNEFSIIALSKNEGSKKMSDQEKILGQLTEKERDFLLLVCNEEEYTYQQIAGLMGVKVRAVDKYRESIFDKFGIKSKTGLVLFVLKYRLFDKL